jgi:DNA mismatch repair protein MutS
MKDTAIIQQWKEIKDKNSEGFLFYRVGDFYELFYEDAINASKYLGITLTKKINKNENVPMAGVPFHSSEPYINKLLQLGFDVVVCEQVGQILKNQPMKREVKSILTPGTLYSENFLQDHHENTLLTIVLMDKIIGYSLFEISSGRVILREGSIDYLNDIISLFSPNEILISSNLEKFIDVKNKYKIIKNEESIEESSIYIKEILKINNLTPINGNDISTSIVSFSQTIKYILSRNMLNDIFINNIKIVKNEDFLFLDNKTIEDLEIINSRNNGHSLIKTIDRTSTSMGYRNLLRFLKYPIISKKDIINRQTIIKEFHENKIDIESLLSEIPDIERVVNRIYLLTASPYDLVKLIKFLKIIPLIKNKFIKTVTISSLFKDTESLSLLINILDNAINENCSNNFNEGNVINQGYDKDLDKSRINLRKNSIDIIEMEDSLKLNTGIKKLKIVKSKGVGLVIEIPTSNKIKIPENFEIKKSLKSSTKYITNEILELDKNLVHSKLESSDIEKDIFREIVELIRLSIDQIKKLSNIICDIDVYNSVFLFTRDKNYTYPIIGDKFAIKEGRHPVLDSLTNNFTPNSLFIDEFVKGLCITGPNMGGKSTYMKQIAIISLLAHCGFPIPANEGSEIPSLDKIITRIGASDNISLGQSTFMVEMSEAAKIIKTSTNKSLVLLDEIGRGTGTFDGISIAYAILKKIMTEIKPFTLFSTHYLELTKDFEDIINIRNVFMDTKIENKNLIFSHKVKDGFAKKSYGIEVASIAGIPDDVIKVARDKYNDIAFNDFNIDELDIDNISPLDAINILYNIKNKLSSK